VLQVRAAQLFYNARLCLAMNEKSIWTETLRGGRSSATLLEVLVDDLLFGDQIHNTRPGLQVSEAAQQLWLRNGCVDNNGWYYQMDECETCVLVLVV